MQSGGYIYVCVCRLLQRSQQREAYTLFISPASRSFLHPANSCLLPTPLPQLPSYSTRHSAVSLDATSVQATGCGSRGTWSAVRKAARCGCLFHIAAAVNCPPRHAVSPCPICLVFAANNRFLTLASSPWSVCLRPFCPALFLTRPTLSS